MICNDNHTALDPLYISVPSRKMSNRYLVCNEPEESQSLLLNWEHEQQDARACTKTSHSKKDSNANVTSSSQISSKFNDGLSVDSPSSIDHGPFFAHQAAITSHARVLSAAQSSSQYPSPFHQSSVVETENLGDGNTYLPGRSQTFSGKGTSIALRHQHLLGT